MLVPCVTAQLIIFPKDCHGSLARAAKCQSAMDDFLRK